MAIWCGGVKIYFLFRFDKSFAEGHHWMQTFQCLKSRWHERDRLCRRMVPPEPHHCSGSRDTHCPPPGQPLSPLDWCRCWQWDVKNNSAVLDVYVASEWEELKFSCRSCLTFFPKCSWGVFALSHLPSGLGLKNKIVERKNPDGDSAGLDVKISSPLWVGAHLYTWFMPVGMSGTDLTNDKFWMVASNVINVCWLGALPNFELLSIVWGWTRAAWVLKYFHVK